MVKIKVHNDEGKPWYQSKTMWAAILQVSIGLSLIALQQAETGIPVTLSGVLHVYLRKITKEGISFN